MKRGHRNTVIVTVAVVAGAAGAVQLRPGSGTREAVPDPVAAPGADGRYPVYVNRPAGPPRVDTGHVDERGNPVYVSCMSCHATRTPNAANRQAADLDEFHEGLTYAHGSLACLACHNRDDYDALRLADGRRLAYVDAMELCAQCHGAQVRDYERGVHGGMRGYWDLTRGPRYRNHCLDCHDAHAPAFPRMMPTFKPRDRFLTPDRAGPGAGHE